MSQSRTNPGSYRIRIAPTADGSGDRVPDLSPREAFERWLARLRGTKAEATVSSYHYRLKHFIEWCDENGIVSIAEISGWDIDTYETHRRGEGMSPLSLNKELGTLRNFLDYCARIDLVDESLPEKVDPPDVPRDLHVDETRLAPDHAEALLDYYDATPEARGSRAHALLALAWYTGARLGAIRALDLGHYNSEEELVEFHHRPRHNLPLKNGRDGERAVGIPGFVCDVLDEYIEHHRYDKHDENGQRPLLTSQVGRASDNAGRTWMYLATVPCLHTDCPHGNERDSCEFVDYSHISKCPSSRSPHQVRTGSITWQLNRGMPIEAVAERVNTSVRTLKRHYDQPTNIEALEERRRHHIRRLGFGERGDDE